MFSERLPPPLKKNKDIFGGAYAVKKNFFHVLSAFLCLALYCVCYNNYIKFMEGFQMEIDATISLVEKISKDGKKYPVLRLKLRSGYSLDIMDFNAVREVQNLIEVSKLYGIIL